MGEIFCSHFKLVHIWIENHLETWFSSKKKMDAKNILGLPKEKKLILIIVSSLKGDERKGSNFVSKLSKIMKEHLNNYQFIVVGMNTPLKSNIDLNDFIFLGKFNDDYSMALAYSAADVFVLMSKADNLPNTVAESLACGTPVVSFSIGGIPEMIEHKVNGFLAKPFNIEEIVKGIKFVIDSTISDYKKLSIMARRKAESYYDITKNSSKYLEVLKQMLSND